MELNINKINKYFGDFHVLKDISFNVSSGRAMGFLGRNGAGKTTTIRILMDVFRQNSGSITLDNKNFNTSDYRIGYLPEERGMYDKESIIKQLIYFGVLKGMDKKDAKKEALYWLEKLGLEEHEKKLLNTLSKGNQQKIQIIQALLGNPDIIILDEPFSGLDPVNSKVLKEIIREKIKENKLVIFSSHQMSYVEEFCDDITLINNGEIVLSGNLDDIKREMGKNKIIIKSSLSNNILSDRLKNIENISLENDKEFLIIKLLNGKLKEELLKEIILMDIEIELFSLYKPSLTNIFIEKVGGNEKVN